MAKQIRGNSVNVERHPHDFYPTDARWTQALQRHVQLGNVVWECAAGEGHMVEALKADNVIATDLELDFLSGDAVELAKALPNDVSIVTNPPYKYFDQFIEQALDLTEGVVAMLGNLQALGGINRTTTIWTKTPPSLVLVVPQRMVVNGSPSQFCHAWFVWKSHHPTTTLIWDELKDA